MKNRGFEYVSRIKLTDYVVCLPKRATKNSAGYDFYCPECVLIPAGELRLVKTGIKAYMCSNEFLSLHVRSSIGIKRNLMLANTTGIIDSDYYDNPDNEGEILVPLYNYGLETQRIEAGERIAQGIFNNYNQVDNDTANEKRVGGVGSTNNK